MVAGPSTTIETRRVEVPRPRTFGGSRNAQEVDNFLYGLDQYLGAVGIVEDASKIQTASLYLTDTAMLWWRRRRHDIEKGTCTISTFDDFKRELKRQFYPENAEDEARARLRRLKQSGSIRDYIKEFTNLVLEIPDLSDKDSLFNFMDGLQPWAKTELKRRGVQDLADAIAKAESLVDYSNHKESTPKPRDWKSIQAKGGGERSQRQESHRDDSPLRHKESSPWKGKMKATDSQNSRKPSSNKCFICDGDHWVRECPQRQALSSLLARHQESNDDDSCQEGAHIGSLQQFNGIQSTPKTEATGLLYADVTVNGKATRAMLDTGASHNFVSIDEADRLGLKATGAKGAVKAINSAARPIHGVAQEVKTIVGTWSGRMNYTIVPMDDFKVILGLEFFNQAKAIPMPFANAMTITEGKQACVVPTVRATMQKVKVLSALQLEEFEKVTKEKANNQGSFKITKGPQLTTSPSHTTSYERERLAQHKGAKHCKKRADKKRRPSRFKRGSAHRRSKKGVRESPVVNQGPAQTIPRQPRDEGIAGLGGGECHDPPKAHRVKPSTLGRFSEKQAPRKDKRQPRKDCHHHKACHHDLEGSTRVWDAPPRPRRFKAYQEDPGAFKIPREGVGSI
ncbi:hypothetical protein GQ457_16G025850 [Hibiscus cannabinus]